MKLFDDDTVLIMQGSTSKLDKDALRRMHDERLINLDHNAPVPQVVKVSEVKPLTPDEFYERMRYLAQIAADGGDWEGHHIWAHDWEELHIRADDMLCKLLTSLGYGKGVDVFEDMPKWYA